MNPSPVPSPHSIPHWFIALPLPEHVCLSLDKIASALRGELDFGKWTHPADYHITLVFLGAFPTERLTQLSEELAAAARNTVPFSLASSGLGCFGHADSPRVLWANVPGELEPLARLQNDVETRLAVLGHVADNRPYSPHITLARKFKGPKPPQAVIAAAAQHLQQQPVDWLADELVLYASHPQESPMYRPLARFAFGQVE